MSSQDALKALEIDLSVSRQLGRSPIRFFTMRSLYILAFCLLCHVTFHRIYMSVVCLHSSVFTFLLSRRSSLERNTILSNKFDLCQNHNSHRDFAVRGLHNRDFAISQDFLFCGKFRTRAWIEDWTRLLACPSTNTFYVNNQMCYVRRKRPSLYYAYCSIDAKSTCSSLRMLSANRERKDQA